MPNVVGDIAVTVGADVSGLQDGMRRGGKSVDDFDSRISSMRKGLAKTVASLGVFGGLSAAGMIKSASDAARTAKEIQNLSDIAGLSASSFQKMSAASDTVGIGQEKLADIFKDVNDKFGDFMANRAGPLKDFFDNIAPQVGLTADQFARLSGPEALQLYVSALEKAGLSQQQMTFYMEALASDATGLLPLLRDNGREMQRLGDEAQRAGRILGDDAVKAGADLDRKMSDLAKTVRNNLTRSVLENADEIKLLSDFIADPLIPALGSVITVASNAAAAIVDIATSIGNVISQGNALYERSKEWAKVSGLSAHSIFGEDESQWPAWLQALRGPVANNMSPGVTTGTGLTPGDALTPNEVMNPYQLPEVVIRPGSSLAPSSSIRPQLPSVDFGQDPNKGGGGNGLSDDLERLQRELMTREELLAQWREDQLIKLEEFREAGLITEEKYNELEQAIERDHHDALTEITRRGMQAKLAAWSGALSDLSALMQTENTKLFKIGQAAALAEAVVSGHAAAISAWEKGMKIGGPPLAAAFTAASIAKTGAMIASIASASPNSRSSGSAVDTTVAATPVAPPTQNVLIDFRGDQSQTNSLRGLVDMINEAGRNGYVLNIKVAG